MGEGGSTCSCHPSYGGEGSPPAANPDSCKLGPYKEGGGGWCTAPATIYMEKKRVPIVIEGEGGH